MVKLLMEKETDVNSKNVDGQTPLDIAMNENHKDIVELLRKRGAK